MRVPVFLAEQHVLFETIVHPPAFSAQKRAKALHCPGRQVAKSVLLVGPGGKLLAVLPATHHLDEAALALALGGPVRLADRWEVAEVFPDCEWGAVPPFGRLYGMQTLMDESLDPDDWIIFESHTHAEAIRMHGRDFERLERPRRLAFARPMDQ
jgi:Ala-tRNA(Pro) deacylase